MNKRELVWLIVRLIGVYFLYLTFSTLLSLPGTVSTLYSLAATSTTVSAPTDSNRTAPPVYPAPRNEPDTQNVKKSDPATEQAKSEAFKNLLKSLFLSGIYGFLGYYLTKKGRVLFDILNNESSTTRQEKDPAVTTLKL